MLMFDCYCRVCFTKTLMFKPALLQTCVIYLSDLSIDIKVLKGRTRLRWYCASVPSYLMSVQKHKRKFVLNHWFH